MEEPPELKLTVASFLRGLLETSEDEGEKMPPEPKVLEFSLWVPWKAERCETLEWWMELLAVPGIEDSRKLAREVWASFGLPWQLQELGLKEATLQAPPALTCLCRQSLCCQLIQSLLVGTLGKSLGKKWWHMQQPSRIGWSKIIHLLEVSHDYW